MKRLEYRILYTTLYLYCAVMYVTMQPYQEYISECRFVNHTQAFSVRSEVNRAIEPHQTLALKLLLVCYFHIHLAYHCILYLWTLTRPHAHRSDPTPPGLSRGFHFESLLPPWKASYNSCLPFTLPCANIVPLERIFKWKHCGKLAFRSIVHDGIHVVTFIVSNNPSLGTNNRSYDILSEVTRLTFMG